MKRILLVVVISLLATFPVFSQQLSLEEMSEMETPSGGWEVDLENLKIFKDDKKNNAFMAMAMLAKLLHPDFQEWKKPRTWKSTKGSTVEAIFVGMVPGEKKDDNDIPPDFGVVLKRMDNGKLIEIPYSKLDDDCQAFVFSILMVEMKDKLIPENVIDSVVMLRDGTFPKSWSYDIPENVLEEIDIVQQRIVTILMKDIALKDWNKYTEIEKEGICLYYIINLLMAFGWENHPVTADYDMYYYLIPMARMVSLVIEMNYSDFYRDGSGGDIKIDDLFMLCSAPAFSRFLDEVKSKNISNQRK